MREHLSGLVRVVFTVGLAALAIIAVLPSVSAATEAQALPLDIKSSTPQIESGKDMTATVRIVRSDATGLLLELSTPTYAFTPIQVDNRSYESLSVPGLSFTDQAGNPQLPVADAVIGVPPDADVAVRVIGDDSEVLPGKHMLIPAESPAPIAGELQPGGWQRVADRAAYAKVKADPAQPALVADDAWLRDQRVVRIAMFPFQYSARDGQVTWHRTLRIEIAFNRKASKAFEAVPADSSPFDDVLRGSLLNYEQARAWRAEPIKSPRPTVDLTPRTKIVVDHDGLYEVTYADLLAAGVDVTNVVPSTFHLTSQQQDVAIEVTGEADGHFDPGDSILFYGQKLRGDVLAARYAAESDNWLTFDNGWHPTFNAQMVEEYSNENAYWLSSGGTPGPRMNTSDGTPTGSAPAPDYYTATVHAENVSKWKTTTFSSVDVFFWDVFGAPGSSSYTTTLSAVANAPVSATVRAEIAPSTYSNFVNPDHRVQLLANTPPDLLADVTWDGLTRQRLIGRLPQSQLADGTFTVTLNALLQPGMSVDTLYFDWFEVEYARRFEAQAGQLTFNADQVGPREYRVGQLSSNVVTVLDISNPLLPEHVLAPAITSAAGQFTATFEVTHTSPVTYFVAGLDQVQSPKSITRYVPPDLSGGVGADYLIITHHDFITAAQVLADYRASQGFRTRVIDVADLYNEYNDGIFHPIAIKNFLRDAYDNWPRPAPSYVLLVGDGHWNFKGYSIPNYATPETAPIYMPPNLSWVDPWQGEVDSSNLLAAVAGNDILPDMYISRIPVNSVAELNAVISKTISYEQSGILPFERRAVFVADNIPDPKGAGDFIASSEAVINNYLPPAYAADRIYENNFGCLSFSTCPQVNYALTRTLNLTGALFVNYTGHGSTSQWSDEQVFVNADVATLTNTGRLPIYLSMTCLDGYWMHANIGANTSLVELSLRAANGGAVAAFSPTGLGVGDGHDSLQQGFYTAVFANGVQRLGPAALAAKLQLFSTGNHYDLIETFTVFGDPALRLPTYALSMMPMSALAKSGHAGEVVTYTLRVTNSAFLTDSLSYTSTGDLWPISFLPVSVPPSQGRDVIVSVTIPVTAPLGMSDVATVTIKSHGDATRLTAVLTTTNPAYGASLAPTTLVATGQRGRPVTYTLHLTNIGGITTTYRIDSLGPWASTVSSDTLGPLAATAGQDFDVYVQVPASAVGRVTTTVTATVQDGPPLFATAALVTIVDPYRLYLPLLQR